MKSYLLKILATGVISALPVSTKAQDAAQPAPAAAADAGFVHYAHNDHLNKRGNDLRKLLEQDSVNVYELDEATMLAISAHKAAANAQVNPSYLTMVNYAISVIRTVLPGKASNLEEFLITDKDLFIGSDDKPLTGKSAIIQKPAVDFISLTPSERLNGSLAKLDKALKTEPLNARELNLATFSAIADCKLYMSENSPDSLQEYSIQILDLLDTAFKKIEKNSPHIAAALKEDIEALKSEISSPSIWDAETWEKGSGIEFWRAPKGTNFLEGGAEPDFWRAKEGANFLEDGAKEKTKPSPQITK